MNKRVLFNNRFDRLNGRVYVPSDCIDPLPDVKDKDSQLLDYIFGCDPVTHMPKGDLAIYLSENTNPEVKAFIEMNLLRERSDISESALSLPPDVVNAFKGKITDDDIENFSRHHGEDREQYAQRLKDYFADVKYQNALKKESARLKKLIKDASKDDD